MTCLSDQFQCQLEGEDICLPSWLKCNGLLDCDGGIDELGCESKFYIWTIPSVLGAINNLSIRVKQIILVDYPLFPELRCSHDHWLCDDGERCIASWRICDGVRNCKDNSDEAICSESK